MPEIPQPSPEAGNEKFSDEQLLRNEAASEEQAGDATLSEGDSPLEHYENAAMLEEEADEHAAMAASEAQKPLIKQAERKEELAEQANVNANEMMGRGRNPRWEYAKAARLNAEAEELRDTAGAIKESVDHASQPELSEIEILKSKLSQDISDEERNVVLAEIEKREG